MTRVIELGQDDLRWDWADGGCSVVVGGDGLHVWTRRHKVDPWPCYPHDPAVVRRAAEAIEARVPLPTGFAPVWYVLRNEPLERMNGWTDRALDHWWKPAEGQAKAERPWSPWIVLAGKRVPPHPAVTRYLVAHEYGHVVDYWLQRLAGRDPGESDDEWDREYAQMRGIEPEEAYHGPTWHRSVGEIIACDFRILVAKAEREFWPHPGIARPEELPAVRRWWRRQMRRAAA